MPRFGTSRASREIENALSFSFWGDFGKELFYKACHALIISRIDNWHGTDFKMGVGTRCSECRERASHVTTCKFWSKSEWNQTYISLSLPLTFHCLF